MTKKQKQKSITLGEFKTWIDGYCSASGPDWSPSLEQWVLIRAKIEAISVNDTQPKQSAKQPSRTNYAQPTYAQPTYADSVDDGYIPYVAPASEQYVPPPIVALPPKQQLTGNGTRPDRGNGISADTVGAPSQFG